MLSVVAVIDKTTQEFTWMDSRKVHVERITLILEHAIKLNQFKVVSGKKEEKEKNRVSANTEWFQ